MLKSIKADNKFIVALVTMTVIFCAIAYYLFFYVRGREDDYARRKFRALDQVGRNMLDKKRNLDFIADLYANGFRNVTDKDRFIKENRLSQFLVTYSDSVPVEALVTDTLCWTSKQQNNGYLIQRMPFGDFVGNLLRRADFEEFIVVETRQNKIGGKSELLSNVIYRTFEPWADITKLDSVLRVSSGMRLTDTRSMLLKGVLYRTFAQQVNIPHQGSQSKKWTIIGLVKESTFRSSTRSITTWALVQLSMLAFFLLLGMPLIKLWVMNIYERLQSSNVWFSGMSIIVGMTVVTLLIVSLQDYYNDQYSQGDRLKSLSSGIAYRFELELMSFDSLLSKAKDSKKLNLPQAAKGAQSSGWFVDDIFLKAKNFPVVNNPFFNELLWLGEGGRTDTVVATHFINPDVKLPEVATRDYYRNVVENRMWRMKNGQQFALQSIFSRVNNQPEVGMGVKHGQGVLAVAAKMLSVMDVHMPPGYTFCIADRSGRVWFHPNSSYNLQENIVEETESDRLQTCLQARIEFEGLVRYHDLLHEAYGVPIRNVPLYIVVLKQQDYYTTPLILTIAFVAAFMCLLFLSQAMQLLMLFLISYKSTKLKRKRFFLHWMRPRSAEAYQNLYNRLVWTFGLVLVAQFVILAFWHRHPSALVGFVTLPVLTAAFVYYSIKSRKTALWRRRQPMLFLLFSIAWVLLINIGFYRWIDNTEPVIQWACQGSFIALLLAGGAIPWPAVSFNRYTWMLLLWLATVSVVPVLMFYRAGHFYQNQIWSRYQLWEAARSQQSHKAAMAETLSAMLRTEKMDSIYSNRKTAAAQRGNYLYNTNEITVVPIALPQAEGRATFEAFTETLYPLYDSLLRKAYSGTHRLAKDNSWYTVSNDTSVVLVDSDHDKAFAQVTPPFQFGVGPYGVLFLLAALVMMWVAYVVIRFTVNRIYGNQWYNFTPTPLTAEMLTLEQWRRVFYVSLPGSDTSKIIESIDSKHGVERIDFSKSSWLEWSTPTAKVVLVTGLENGLHNQELLDAKIRLLRRVRNFPDQWIMICSTVPPSQILDFIEKKATEGVRDNDGDARKEIQLYKYQLREWKSLLCDFSVVNNPLSFDSSADSPWIEKELRIGTRLKEQEKWLKKDLEGRDFEDQVLQLSERFETYYYCLWTCFSRSERFILYDLARDRYVNLKNKASIQRLIDVGVIRKEDTLRVMNDSFCEFILNVTSDRDREIMQNQAEKQGTWSSVQLVLILVVVGLASFLALTQQQFFNQLNTILTAVGAAVALLLRFGGLFGGDKAR